MRKRRWQKSLVSYHDIGKRQHAINKFGFRLPNLRWREGEIAVHESTAIGNISRVDYGAGLESSRVSDHPGTRDAVSGFRIRAAEGVEKQAYHTDTEVLLWSN